MTELMKRDLYMCCDCELLFSVIADESPVVCPFCNSEKIRFEERFEGDGKYEPKAYE